MRTVWMLLALTACSRTSGTFDLGARTEIVVDDEGALTVVIDGAETFALARSPEVRTFTETWSGPFAIYTFEREDETTTDLTIQDIDIDGASLVIRYAEGATLRIAAEGDRTSFELSYEGQADSLVVPVRCDDDGSFHGFGEQYVATNLKGHAFDLMVEEQGIGREEDGFEPLSLSLIHI